MKKLFFLLMCISILFACNDGGGGDGDDVDPDNNRPQTDTVIIKHDTTSKVDTTKN